MEKSITEIEKQEILDDISRNFHDIHYLLHEIFDDKEPDAYKIQFYPGEDFDLLRFKMEQRMKMLKDIHKKGIPRHKYNKFLVLYHTDDE
jgi:thiamine monophosphate kinase